MSDCSQTNTGIINPNLDEVIENCNSSSSQGSKSPGELCDSIYGTFPSPSASETQNSTNIIESSTSQLDSSAPNDLKPSGSGLMRLKLVKPFLTILKIFFPSWIFAKFFVSSLIPPLADNLIPLFFTGNIPDESGLAVASQFTFISIILEVVQEGVGNSLFHFVGQNYLENRPAALTAFKLSLLVLFVAGVILTVLMLLFTPQFVDIIDTPESIAEATRHYLYTSALSFTPTLLKTAFNNYLLISTSIWLVASQSCQVVLSFLLNFFLFGQHDWSLRWAVDQLGYYKILHATLTMLISFIFVLCVEKLGFLVFLCRQFPVFQNFRTSFWSFFKVSWGNFGDSAVRNFFYFVVTLKFMNKLGEDESAAWNLLNGIIWGVALIPAYVVANYAKVRIGHDSSKSRIILVAKECSICLLAWAVVVALLTATLWPTIAEFFGKENAEVRQLSQKMLHNVGWVFIVFASNNALDSLFYGTGKTQYVFYQSLATNLIVYFVPWVMYLLGVLEPTFWWVMGLYIAGMILDFLLTLYFCVRVWNPS